LRPLIAEAIDRWFETLAPRTDPRTFVAEVFHASGLRAPVEHHLPDLVDEVEGIAAGAGQPVEALFAWQLVDECWWYLDELEPASDTEAGTAHETCSALAVNDGTSGWVAQTMDLYRHADGGQVLLRYRDGDGLEILAPSAAGLLAYNGLNSAGVAVCVTTLSELAHQRSGVASGFAMARLLRCRSVDEALGWLRTTPLASGNSWTMGSARRSVTVEASAAAVDGVADGDRAVHTNHALVQAPVEHHIRFASSAERLDQLRSAARPNTTLPELARVYATAPVCQSRAAEGDVVTVATTIFELGPAPVCHYAPGPLDSERLRPFHLSS
jgi:hypothetical protein